MSSKNGLINNAQRKALVDVIISKYATKAKNAQNRIDGLMDRALDFTKKKLGYNIIQKEIATLESKIKFLKNKCELMGFSYNGSLETRYDGKTGQFLPVASVANKMITGKISETTESIDNEKQDIISKMWLTKTATEAQRIIAGIRL